MTALGSVSSLGVGSGFELQQMLEDFRKVDEVPIDAMRDDITEIEKKITNYDEIKTKLIDIKSKALSLSLESTFMERTVSVSDEDVATATVLPGSAVTSNSLDIARLATKSSWQTAGVADTDTIAYIPTVQETTAGMEDTDQAAAVQNDGTLTLTYGSSDTLKTMSIDLTAGMTLDDVVEAINTDGDNDDGAEGTLVNTSTFTDEDGQYQLRIASTASGGSESNRIMITAAPDGMDFQAPDVTFTYSLGDGEPIGVAVSADTTFTKLAELINADENNAGITASVINDGSDSNPYRLVITADNTGEDNRISVSGITMSEVQGADGESLNAEIKVDGILYQRQTNTGITDIVQGVTLNLEKEGTATVALSTNTETIRGYITGLVDSYNDIVNYIKENSAFDEETEEWGALNTAYSIKALPSQLNGMIGTVIDTWGGSISSLYDLGMEVNRNGSITIDEEILDQVLATKLEDISAFFTTDDDIGRKGFADILNDSLRDMTASNGLVTNEKNYAENRINRLEDDIEAATDRLDNRYDILTRQFIELDRYIGVMNSQSEYLTQMIDSFNNNSNSK